MKVRKGDTVLVIAGKDKGAKGKMLQAYPERDRVLVEGVNVAKKHQKGNPNAGVAGGIIEQPMPIDVSNVLVWNPKANKGDRVGFRFEGEGAKRRKVRYFKSNKEAVDG